MDPRQLSPLTSPSPSASSPARLHLPAVLGARPVLRERLRAWTATVAAR